MGKQSDEHTKETLKRSAAFDQETVEAAKREAAVMAVMDSQLQA